MGRLPSFQGFAPDDHLFVCRYSTFLTRPLSPCVIFAMRKAGSSGLFLQTSECYLDESEVGLLWRPAVL